MKAQLKKLTSDSAIYGVSNILGRFVTFLLVPFYTNVLPADEFGLVIVVYSYMGFLNVFFTFGLEPSYMRYVVGADTERKRAVFSSIVWFITGTSLLFAAALMLFQGTALEILEIPPSWDAILPLAALTIAIDAVNTIPLAMLRMENRPRRFAAVRLASIFIYVGLNVYFIGIQGRSIVWIFIAGLIASAATTALLAPSFFKVLRPRVQLPLLRELLEYGLPTLPAAAATVLIPVFDKIIMQRMADHATVGIYGTSTKLGIFMMLVATVFRYAWQPFYLQMADEPNAKRLFARVLTYYLLITSALLVVLTLFMENLVAIPLPGGRYLIKPEYWSGLGIVPIMMLAYLITGVGYVFNAGFYIEKQTKHILYQSLAGAAVNIIANLALIPLLGMYGGALAAVLAYATIAGMAWHASRTVYPMRYENARMFKITLSVAVVGLLWYLVPAPPLLSDIPWKILLCIVFTVLLGIQGFFTPEELREARALARRLRPKT